MAPPGRRRDGNVVLSILLPFLLLLPSTAIAQSVVLGIDLGTEYIKAALVKPGIPLEIVLSKDSKRKEASAVAFKTPKKPTAGEFPERSYGPDALALAPRFPADVYPNLKPLLGLPVSENPVVERYSKAYPALNVVATGERATTGFRSPSFGADDPPFAVEEILAMELKNVKENAQTLAGKAFRVENAVFTVPPFYTAEERRALALAADLAGLKVLGLVSDGLAVGVNYATTRTFPSVNEGGKAETHMVLDIGAGSTTASVLRMQGRTVKDVGRFNKTIQEVVVLGAGWDRTLGGDVLNHGVVDDMVEKFVASPGAKSLDKPVLFDDVRKHGRTAAKLWREAVRVRQVLSANQETVASFEGLYEDVDFKYKLSRAAFEEQAAFFAERLEAPVKQALKAANLTFSDLDSVILHGGASRTPFIQKKLEALAGDASKLRSNVNADEAAVFGAAFKAARLSPSFRVKEVVDRDAASYATWLRWKADGKEKSQKIFTPSSGIGLSKQVPFPNLLEDFTFTMYQSLGAEDPAAPKDGGATVTVATSNLTKSVKELTSKHGCKIEDIKHVWSLRLDPVMGLPEAVQGTVSCEVMVEEKKGGLLDDAKGLFGFGKKADKQQVLEDDEAISSTSDSSTSSSKSDSANDAKSTATKEESPKATSTVESIKIAFEVKDGGVTIAASEVTRMKQRLAAFDASDKTRRAREEDLNNLESFTYKVRDYLEDEGFGGYMSAAQKSALETLQKATSEWLGDHSHGASSEVLKEKLKEMKDIVNPALKRRNEATRRPELLKLLETALNSTKGFVEVMQGSIAEAEKVEARVSSEAAEAAKSAAESQSASSTTASSSEAAAASSADPLAELEEDQEPVASDATSTSSGPGAMPSGEPMFSPYTSEDLKELSATYESVSSWLEGKIKAQAALQPHDDPVFDSRELERETRRLNDALRTLINRKMYNTPKSKSKKAGANGGKAKGKSKGKKKADTVKEKEASWTASEFPKESQGTEQASSSTRTRDEL